MKYKKYLLITILIVLLGCIKCDKLLAAEAEQKYCYYLTDDKQTNVRYDKTKYKFYIDKRGENFVTKFKEDGLINRTSSKTDDPVIFFIEWVPGTRIEIPKISVPTECPRYIVYRHYKDSSDGIWGFDSNNHFLAIIFNEASNNLEGMQSWLLSSGYTAEDYYGAMVPIDAGGEEVPVDCNALFGNKDDETSLAYLIDSALQYVRIIVPILLILLGTLDIGKAVIASREEEMRKAQTTFIKRAIAAICVFLVPIFVNIVMSLADIVWQGKDYSYCTVMSYKEK